MSGRIFAKRDLRGTYPVLLRGGIGTVQGIVCRGGESFTIRSLAALDRYEGAAGAGGEYVRRPMNVQLDDGGTLMADAYLYNKRVTSDLVPIPHGDFAATLPRPGSGPSANRGISSAARPSSRPTACRPCSWRWSPPPTSSRGLPLSVRWAEARAPGQHRAARGRLGIARIDEGDQAGDRRGEGGEAESRAGPAEQFAADRVDPRFGEIALDAHRRLAGEQAEGLGIGAHRHVDRLALEAEAAVPRITFFLVSIRIGSAAAMPLRTREGDQARN